MTPKELNCLSDFKTQDVLNFSAWTKTGRNVFDLLESARNHPEKPAVPPAQLHAGLTLPHELREGITEVMAPNHLIVGLKMIS